MRLGSELMIIQVINKVLMYCLSIFAGIDYYAVYYLIHILSLSNFFIPHSLFIHIISSQVPAACLFLIRVSLRK
jgi:hypothetical protein